MSCTPKPERARRRLYQQYHRQGLQSWRKLKSQRAVKDQGYNFQKKRRPTTANEHASHVANPTPKQASENPANEHAKNWAL